MSMKSLVARVIANEARHRAGLILLTFFAVFAGEAWFTPRLLAQNGGRTRSLTATPAESLLARATALMQQGKVAEAEAATRDALAAEPRNPDAHALLGVILFQLSHREEAERELRA